MIVWVHGFDWEAYTRYVMPAFKDWLLEANTAPLYQLYSQTLCAREEQFLPPALYSSRTWTRAQSFVAQLPQGAHTRREYQILCNAETFTSLSDRYVHHHPPQLYPNSDALRSIWGALIAEYCQVSFTLPREAAHEGEMERKPEELSAKQMTDQGEILSLLYAAGLGALAGESSQPPATQSKPFVNNQLDSEEEEEEWTNRGGTSRAWHGTHIGKYPTTLHLRGWLAGISIRALALFELLACGRRQLPFGYRSGELYEDTIGYLTPDEVVQFAQCLRHAQAPDPLLAQLDYTKFRHQQNSRQEFRMLDEVLPAHATALLTVTRMAAQYHLGLLCRI
ncbi:hypothetical protein [Dictyobacter arantiisoli]|uniref:Uncharacterized protein n=1 Tax=Dictyobacter arantiisoli TaxID=2014874 RepID=A0A5A5T8A1_9CHLR|nr:hypothetical protein [Dictyobacter arantiisoli]GCF07638.1 hypothetical protein KDI_12020 [Dictyobacter arantiisoli]